ncbi:MAG: hypothetical protein BWZ10_00908 [candidate division BRC1 bacterium ADurb.BinA364]|nr:MAG: hypothetical protein BWZ10_00908 [candidate division BRC1 bacterium ADurb.BinA364]
MRVFCSVCCSFFLAAAAGAAGEPGCRIRVAAGAGEYARIDKPVVVPLDFTQALKALGREAAFSEASLRVMETTGSGAPRPVPFQFDRAEDFNALSNAKGELVFLMPGETPAGTTRLFDVLFDDASQTFEAAAVEPLVETADNVEDEGQACFRFATPRATYYYQKQGAGFSSLLDADGADWISFHPGKGTGAAGEFRGIPNAGHPQGYMHPGFTESETALVSQGPLRAVIRSESRNGAFAGQWEIYPHFATMTFLKAADPYWVLYEGTPGGECDVEKDFWIKPDGSIGPLGQAWDSDLPSIPWAAFADGAANRSIFLAQHDPDDAPDSYYYMENSMTVFGFGRLKKGKGGALVKQMTAIPNSFTIGLVEDRTRDGIAAAIDSAIAPLEIEIGQPQAGGS